MSLRNLVSLHLVVLLAACGGSGTEPPPDGGGTDGGTTVDAGDVDGGGTTDGGDVDGGGGPGTTCMASRDCAMGAFCNRDMMCGGTGTCEVRPTAASCVGMPIDPVCGCDGRDYTDACLAHAMGQSVATTGACATGPMCPATPPPTGCCYRSADCGTGTTGGGECVDADCAMTPAVAGTCHSRMGLTPGQCWTDRDCASASGMGTCTGARVCACGAACIVPDMPGTCM